MGFVAPGSIVLRWPGIPGDLTLFTGDSPRPNVSPLAWWITAKTETAMPLVWTSI
ncbi:MAG: hypothetical protein ACLR1T_15925 [Evtepia gabavorous]